MLNFEEINEDFEVVCYWWCHGMGECLAVVSVVCTCFESAFCFFIGQKVPTNRFIGNFI
jgi:hypothetical protein